MAGQQSPPLTSGTVTPTLPAFMATELIFSPIEEIIAEVAAGRIVIVADDPDRENEADLIGAASLCTPEIISFMAVHGCPR